MNIQRFTLSQKTNSTNVAFKPFENSIYDMRGLLRLLDELALVERALFRGNEGTISAKSRDFTNSGVIFLFEEVEKAGLEEMTDVKQLAFLKNLVSYLKSLPVVKVTLAFAPTITFLEKISGSISDIVQKKTLVDLVVDEYIVGGAIFEFRGRVSKQTLDVQLEQALGKGLLVHG